MSVVFTWATTAVRGTSSGGGDAPANLSDSATGSDSDGEILTSKPVRASDPPSSEELEAFNDIANVVSSLSDEMENQGSVIYFRNMVFLKGFAHTKIPAGLTSKVLLNQVQPLSTKGKPKPDPFPAVILYLWAGMLFVPDNHSTATVGDNVAQQGYYDYSKDQQLQTVRLWLMLILLHHFADGRSVCVVDPLTQTAHALTCSQYLTDFLDEQEGKPNYRDMELTYATEDCLATAKNLCKICAPQYVIQAMLSWA